MLWPIVYNGAYYLYATGPPLVGSRDIVYRLRYRSGVCVQLQTGVCAYAYIVGIVGERLRIRTLPNSHALRYRFYVVSCVNV